MKGHPIRGFFAGLLLGICLDLDLALGGVVKLDSTTLTIVPIVCIVVGLLLGLWAPIGRYTKTKKRARSVAAPLPNPVAWPEFAPTEGSATPLPQTWKAPPPPKPAGSSGSATETPGAPESAATEQTPPPPVPPPNPPI